MINWARLAAAFVLSLVVCGAAQQAAIIIGEGKPLAPFIEVFMWLAIAVAAITVLFAIVIHFGPYAGAAPAHGGRGDRHLHRRRNSRSPGIAGNLGYWIALLVVFYYLAPCALAVLIHWLMLRKS